MRSIITFFMVISLAASAFAAGDIGQMLPRENVPSKSVAIHLSGKGTGDDPAIYYAPPKPLHGNYKTMKYHNEFCDHYNCRTCTKIFKNKAAAEKAGYTACGKCGG